METALDIASVVFLLTLLFGVGLLGILIWNYLVRDRYNIRLPPTEDLPAQALDAARETLGQLKAIYFRSSGERRNLLSHEVHRLEMRIQYLQQRTAEDQYPYYQLCRQRENIWREWKQAFDRMWARPRGNMRVLRQDVQRAIRRFRRAQQLVEAEWHRAVVRDELRLEELQTQGVLDLGQHEPGMEFPDEQEAEELASAAEFAQTLGTTEGAERTDQGVAGEATNAAPEVEPGPQGQAAATASGLGPETEAEAKPEPAAAAFDAGGEMASAAAAPADEPDSTPVEAPATGPPPRSEPPPAPQAAPIPALSRAGLPDWGEPPLGEIGQQAIDDPAAPKAACRYRDPTLSLQALPGGQLIGTDLSRGDFAAVRFVGIQRQARCNWAGADLRRIRLERAAAPHQFVECDFSGAHFGEAVVEYALFLRCNLAGSTWDSSRLTGVKFADCNLDGASWENVDLSRTVLAGRSSDSADWSGALRPPRQPRAAPPPDAAAGKGGRKLDAEIDAEAGAGGARAPARPAGDAGDPPSE